MDDYEKYEKECERIRDANEHQLDEFESWLKASGLSEKTIYNHRTNIDFYVNEFLLYADTIEAKNGIHSIGMFLGDWFIRKAMWASRANIKSNAASLKKFYTFLHEKDLITKEDLTLMKRSIKEEMPEWLATLERYDSMSLDDVW